MKKFFVSFFIILIFCGVCFFIGFVQFHIPQGNYGVMVSKTSGQVPLSCYEFFSTEKRCPFCFYISKRAPCFFRKRIGSNPYSS